MDVCLWKRPRPARVDGAPSPLQPQASQSLIIPLNSKLFDRGFSANRNPTRNGGQDSAGGNGAHTNPRHPCDTAASIGMDGSHRLCDAAAGRFATGELDAALLPCRVWLATSQPACWSRVRRTRLLFPLLPSLSSRPCRFLFRLALRFSTLQPRIPTSTARSGARRSPCPRKRVALAAT